MNKKIYLAILTITVKSPKGYTPRSISAKCGFILATKKKDVIDMVIHKETERYQKIWQEQNPDVKVTVTGKVEILTMNAISADYLTPLKDN